MSEAAFLILLGAGVNAYLILASTHPRLMCWTVGHRWEAAHDECRTCSRCGRREPWCVW